MVARKSSAFVSTSAEGVGVSESAAAAAITSVKQSVWLLAGVRGSRELVWWCSSILGFGAVEVQVEQRLVFEILSTGIEYSIL